MTADLLRVGYIPLVDAAPFIVARALGFAEEEGLDLVLEAAPSWSALRDRLVLGQIAAAHMLYPVPVAMALGLGGMPAALDILQVVSFCGDVIGVSTRLAARMRAAGHGFDFADPRAAGRALIAAAEGPLRIGVPFPFSMHAELLYHWLGALGVSAPQSLHVRTVPPGHMARALAEGEIDAFCVGSPFGSVAVETGVGELLLPTAAIRAHHPEKVLAARRDRVEAEPETMARLMRALSCAGRWLGRAENVVTAAEILARPDCLDLPSEVIERSLTGEMVISPRGEIRRTEGYLTFAGVVQGFPFASGAMLVADRLAARTGLDRAQARAAARAICRTDLYRSAFGAIGADLPLSDLRREGALSAPAPLATRGGQVILPRDDFFDGWIFDPGAED